VFASQAAAVPLAISLSASVYRPSKTREVVGKAWNIDARTAIGVRVWMARTVSWIAAEASGATTDAPTSVPVARSTTIARWPNVASSST